VKASRQCCCLSDKWAELLQQLQRPCRINSYAACTIILLPLPLLPLLLQALLLLYDAPML